MDWKGKWRNQYGSIVSIVDDANHRISGTFKTALKDSGFYGQEIPVVGLHQGDCISFVGAGQTAAGDAAVSYTGLLREGKMETMWFGDQGAERRLAGQARKAQLVALDQHQRGYVRTDLIAPSVPLEILHGALMLFGSGARLEGSKVAAPAGLRIDLAGIEPVLARSQFADHRCASP